jgi:transcription elongation factor Elf1
MPAPAFHHGIAPCPGCQAQLAAPIQAAGRVVSCKSCGTRFALPNADELFESAVAYLLEQEDEREDAARFDRVVRQVQSETMVRSGEQEAHADLAWLG